MPFSASMRAAFGPLAEFGKPSRRRRQATPCRYRQAVTVVGKPGLAESPALAYKTDFLNYIYSMLDWKLGNTMLAIRCTSLLIRILLGY